MNLNTVRYHMLQNVLHEQAMFHLFYQERPICEVDLPMIQHAVELDDRAALARGGINRARFLAKHDRSKYTPHIGAKQIAKGVRA